MRGEIHCCCLLVFFPFLLTVKHNLYPLMQAEEEERAAVDRVMCGDVRLYYEDDTIWEE